MSALPLLAFAFVIAVFVHEAGHAVAGWAVGLPPRVISIGTGPVVFLARFWGATLTIRLFPMSGFVLAVPRLGPGRFRRLVLLAGGVVANIIVIFALALAASEIHRAGGTDSLGIFAAGQFLAVIFAAVPWPLKIQGRRTGSDGLQFLRVLFGRRREDFREIYVRLVAALGPAGRMAAEPSDDAGEILFQFGRRDKETQAWARRDVATAYRRVLARGRLSPEERLFVLEMVLSAELTHRDTGVSAAELDEWSCETVSLTDGIPMRVTRGGVLAALNRGEEARAVLLPIIDQPARPIDAIGCRAFLAEAEAARGETQAARHWMDQARSFVPADKAEAFRPLLANLAARVAEAGDRSSRRTP